MQRGQGFRDPLLFDHPGPDITDRIRWPDADLMFFHCNNRHHSLAIAGEVLGLQAGGIDHFMIEVRDPLGPGLMGICPAGGSRLPGVHDIGRTYQ